jgi:hypothetical protein
VEIARRRGICATLKKGRGKTEHRLTTFGARNRAYVQASGTDSPTVVANSSAVESRATIHGLVYARQQLLYTRAAAKIVSASDERTKSLLDIRA